MSRALFAVGLICLAISLKSQTIELQQKAERIVETIGFDTGLSLLLSKTVPSTTTYAIVRSNCPFKARRLFKEGSRDAETEFHPLWLAQQGAQLLEAYGEEFVASADLKDAKKLETSVRTNQKFTEFMDSLGPKLQPILAEATTSVIETMWNGCENS